MVRRRADFYSKTRPGPADTFLFIEVSNTSLRFDTRVKVPLYARHAIPEYWIVDITSREIQSLRKPDSGTYTDVISTSTPGVASPIAWPEIHIDLAHLFSE